MAPKTIKTLAVCGGVAAATSALTCFLVAGRAPTTQREQRWQKLTQHRYAHRGLHDAHTPENSLTAFRRAIEQGYGIELDLHRSHDGRLVIMHDSELMRMCGVRGTIEEHTYAELRRLRLKETDEHIPLFEEVLSLVEAYTRTHTTPIPLIVELKALGNAAVLTRTAVALLDTYHLTYCIESFDPRVLGWLRAHRPDIIRGQLSENFLRDTAALPYGTLVQAGSTALVGNVLSRPDFVAYRFADRHNPLFKLCCNVLGCHKAYWTIRNEDDLDTTEREGALAIFEGFRPSPRRPEQM